MDKLVYHEYQKFPRQSNYRVGDKLSCARILSDVEFQRTEPWSTKIPVEKALKLNTLFPRRSGKKSHQKNPVQKIFEQLLRSLQICSCPDIAVARSLQILTEKRMTLRP